MTLVEKEIFEQRTVLKEIFGFSKQTFESQKIPKFIVDSDIVYFVGCGSSYYLAIAASKYFSLKTGIETKALVGGEIMFADNCNIGKKGIKKSAILISRSGESSEVVYAGKVLKELSIPTIGITLSKDSSLTKIANFSYILPIDEKSIVMTKSFSSILLFLEIMSDTIANENVNAYKEILDKTESIINDSFTQIEKNDLLNGNHYVFLGVGTYEGIARESALKLQEMSLTTIEAYSTFDYRHGPKSLFSENSIAIIYGNETFEETKLKHELESYGGKVIIRKTLSKDQKDAFLQVIFGQILGLKLAYHKNIDVEKPRNLTKVVKF
ncbi:MAG: hypothetical protein PWP54_1021 [Thermosipho sp. (in: thermotogales)]|nr:hypothetical protein [Thermosipho sp. (in: thermotogales)]MDN5325100.1 hypothetical protein [Thermosipho sp. (in: thermotogales)]